MSGQPFQPVLTGARNPTSDRLFHTGSADQLELLPEYLNWHTGRALEFYTQFDILCYVLSILGRAPRGATRKNHYYPLLVLCSRFLALAAEGKKREPYLASITFIDHEGQQPSPGKNGQGRPGRWKGWATATCDYLFKTEPKLNLILGSTIPLPRDLKATVCEARANLLKKAGFVFVNEERHKDGNCGETYALLSLML